MKEVLEKSKEYVDYLEKRKTYFDNMQFERISKDYNDSISVINSLIKCLEETYEK